MDKNEYLKAVFYFLQSIIANLGVKWLIKNAMIVT